MTVSRTLEIYKELAKKISETHTHDGLKWEPGVRANAPNEFVSELLDENSAQEILSKIIAATPKLQAAFSIVKSNKEPDKRRILVSLPLLHQIDQFHKIVNCPELNVRPNGPSEFVSELLDENSAREILSNITDALPKLLRDAFSIVRSNKEPNKRRILVIHPLLFQLDQLHKIVNYLNNNHAPEGQKTWEVTKTVKDNIASYLICFTNFPKFLESKFNPINEYFYKWSDQPEIESKFRKIEPESRRDCMVYTIRDGELLQMLSELANQPRVLPTPKP